MGSAFYSLFISHRLSRHRSFFSLFFFLLGIQLKEHKLHYAPSLTIGECGFKYLPNRFTYRSLCRGLPLFIHYHPKKYSSNIIPSIALIIELYKYNAVPPTMHRSSTATSSHKEFRLSLTEKRGKTPFLLDSATYTLDMRNS